MFEDPTGFVFQTPIGGGAVTTLASGASIGAYPGGIAVHSGSVYWVDNSGTISRAPVGGGTITTIATGQDNPRGPCISGDNIYWTSSDVNTDVMRWSIGGDGGIPVKLTTVSEKCPSGKTCVTWAPETPKGNCFPSDLTFGLCRQLRIST
jgi:hypothetical protein